MTDYLYTQPNMTGGVDQTIKEIATAVPAFPVMILVFVFLVVVLGGSSNQKRRIGTADYPFWTVLGATTTTVLALIMTIGAGIIDKTVLGIVIAINIMSAIWFFLSSVKGEV